MEDILKSFIPRGIGRSRTAAGGQFDMACSFQLEREVTAGHIFQVPDVIAPVP